MERGGNEPASTHSITNLIPMRLVTEERQHRAQEQYVIDHRPSGTSLVANLSFPRYVQEVETMLSIHIG